MVDKNVLKEVVLTKKFNNPSNVTIASDWKLTHSELETEAWIVDMTDILLEELKDNTLGQEVRELQLVTDTPEFTRLQKNEQPDSVIIYDIILNDISLLSYNYILLVRLIGIINRNYPFKYFDTKVEPVDFWSLEFNDIHKIIDSLFDNGTVITNQRDEEEHNLFSEMSHVNFTQLWRVTHGSADFVTPYQFDQENQRLIILNLPRVYIPIEEFDNEYTIRFVSESVVERGVC